MLCCAVLGGIGLDWGWVVLEVVVIAAMRVREWWRQTARRLRIVSISSPSVGGALDNSGSETGGLSFTMMPSAW